MDPNLRALPQDGSCSGTCPLMVRSAARMSLPEREVERGLEHAQDAVGGSPELPHGIGILDIDVADVLPFRCVRVRRRAGALASAACHCRITVAVKSPTSCESAHGWEWQVNPNRAFGIAIATPR
jgi:hypothetical protein